MVNLLHFQLFVSLFFAYMNLIFTFVLSLIKNTMKKLTISLLLPFMLFAQEAKVCKGTTTKGEPCKSTIVLSDGYCRMHSPSTPRCGETTSKGTPCKMMVKNEGDKCKHHNK